MAKGGNHKLYTEQWFLERGYAKNKDGSFSPPKFKNPFNPVIKPAYISSVDFPKQVIGDTELNYGSKPIMIFEIDPIGKPRMTQSDKWKKRKPVVQYFNFKDKIRAQAAKQNFVMPMSGIHIIFHIAVPHSWSEKKKALMIGSPHQQKPDVDNILKALGDSLLDEDKALWDIRVTKRWARSGKILIYPI